MVESESKLYPAMVFRREKRNTVDSGRPLFIIGMKIKKLMSAKNKLSKKENNLTSNSNLPDPRKLRLMVSPHLKKIPKIQVQIRFTKETCAKLNKTRKRIQLMK